MSDGSTTAQLKLLRQVLAREHWNLDEAAAVIVGCDPRKRRDGFHGTTWTWLPGGHRPSWFQHNPSWELDSDVNHELAKVRDLLDQDEVSYLSHRPKIWIGRAVDAKYFISWLAIADRDALCVELMNRESKRVAVTRRHAETEWSELKDKLLRPIIERELLNPPMRGGKINGAEIARRANLEIGRLRDDERYTYNDADLPSFSTLEQFVLAEIKKAQSA